MYVKTKEASSRLGVCADTLRKWAASGQINTIKTSGGHNLYDVESYTNKYCVKQPATSSNLNSRVIYCRVSSPKQKSDLQRQAEYLSQKYPDHEVFKETASGINFKRKVLYRLLDRAFEGSLKEIVVAHKDRLCRIAWEHFYWLFQKLGVSIVVDSEDEKDCSPTEQLADDLMSIVHVFSSRHYGSRARSRTPKAPPMQAQNSSDPREQSCQTPQPASCEDSSE